MKILFMGTPDFAAEILRSLVQAGENIAAVFTQPGKPRGRGHNVTPSPVAALADELALPCHTPETLKNGAADGLLREIDPELIIVVAYGKLLPPSVLEYPRYGAVNIHASLLPRWRGAAPIQRAIMAGDSETGVTVMQMDAGLDTGDMLLSERVEISPLDDTGSLTGKLAAAGQRTILAVLSAMRDGALSPTKQPEDGMTYAAKLERAEAVLDFSRPARELSLRVRGLSPAPMAATRLGGKLLKIAVALPEEGSAAAAPGTVLSCTADGFRVACGEGVLLVREVVPEGKRRMTAAEFTRGHAGLTGEVLSWQ